MKRVHCFVVCVWVETIRFTRAAKIQWPADKAAIIVFVFFL